MLARFAPVFKSILKHLPIATHDIDTLLLAIATMPQC